MNKFMQLAFELAKKYEGFTSPNPMVGAVVVKDSKIIGTGSHQKAGEPHAEVFALQEAGDEAKGATIYVNLEPCSHYGKTPPCTDLIIKKGIKKVVTAMSDPNPLINGNGHQKLRENNIEVVENVMQSQAEKLNEIFIKNIKTKMVFVALKAAVSLDGKIATATGDSKWITNKQAREKVHKLRNKYDAILIGKNTLLTDNPRLNVRLTGKVSNPAKIILSNQIDKTIAYLEESELVKNNPHSPIYICSSKKKNVEKSSVPNLKIIHYSTLRELSKILYDEGINSILIEGGAQIFSSFIKEKMVDKLYLFQAPKIIGKGGKDWSNISGIKNIKDALHLQNPEFEILGDNILTKGYLRCLPE